MILLILQEAAVLVRHMLQAVAHLHENGKADWWARRVSPGIHIGSWIASKHTFGFYQWSYSLFTMPGGFQDYHRHVYIHTH